jgi:methyl-accepting chemotaxis protein
MMDVNMGANSIRRRLMLSFMTTTGLALVLASASYFGTELYNSRARMVEDLVVLAQMVGSNTTASLLFNDQSDAELTLSALKAEKHVMAAVIYDVNGKAFAGYLREDVLDLPVPSKLEQGHDFGDGSLDLFEPNVMDGEVLGTIFIRSDTDELVQLVQNFSLIFLAVTLGSLVICYLGASLIRNQIAEPLAALVKGSAQMAEGDLSIQVGVASDDELGTLATSFNGMVDSLRALVAQVGRNTTAVSDVSTTLRGSSEAMAVEAGRQEVAVGDTSESIERINASIRNVNESVETLSHTATDTSTAASQMDVSISEIAGHMDGLSETIEASASSVAEMTSAIREIARNADELDGSTESTASALRLLTQAVREVEGNAQESHSLSEKAAEQAASGMQSVQQTVEGMQEIQFSFQGLSQIIDDLSEKSESIGEVVKVIEDVVEQTNLLALNAAIISSQAGEHGRAFAVVAEEVRNLAERTAGSTREISELIMAVQAGVGNAVQAMEQGATRVDRGVNLSREAGEVLRLIGESSRESIGRIHEIVEAAGRQNRDIEKVDEAMGRVKSIAAQLNRGTHEQDSASADITRAVERMKDLGQRVKRSTQEQSKESGLITQSVEIIAARIQEILRSTTEQSKQGDQIAQALQVFREVTHESNRRSDEMRTSLEELSDRSHDLEQEIGRFRL